MDGQRFDALTRSLVDGTTRRRVLRTVGGTLIGGIVAAIGSREVVAKATCRADGNRCSRGDQCCGGGCCVGVCTSLYRDSGNCGACGHACAADQICASNRCCAAPNATCTTDTECCGFSCVDGRCCAPSGSECSSLYDCCSGTCEPLSETPGICA